MRRIRDWESEAAGTESLCPAARYEGPLGRQPQTRQLLREDGRIVCTPF
jgi:hypothetical protein